MTKLFTQKLTPLFIFLGVFMLANTGNHLSAQVVLSTDDSKNGKKTFSCPTNQSFTDDNTNSGLYYDEMARKDTIILCPTSNNYQIKVTFSSFDVASGDELRVYDCDLSKTSCGVSQTATGNGVSNAFGGWVQANCDPAVNASGCLSFEFVTNGDNVKGNGWQASITCENSAVSVQCPSTVSVVDDCNNLDGMVSVTIPKPTFATCGGTAHAMVNITSNCSAIPSMTVLADGGTYGTFTIPLGTYMVTATAVADNSKKCSFLVIADQPTITCNGNVTSTIGLGCSASLSVDDILENPCVGSGTTYKIEVDLKNKGKTASVTVDGSNFSTLSSGYLNIPSSDFECGSEYPVTITRTVNFTSCGGGSSVSTSCKGKIRFVDNSAPAIHVTSQTLTTCGELSDEEIKSKLTINVTDNCAVKDTIVSVGNFPSNFCKNNLSVPVTITAVDHCGNSNTETFNVAIKRPTTFFQPADTLLPCNASTSPDVTGYPLLDTDGDNKGDLPIKDNTCNFIPIYTDQEVTATNSKTKKIFRTWQVKDWCNQKTPVTLPVQLIEIRDTGKPSINCPSGSQKGTKNNPHIVSTGSFKCEGNINFSPPNASSSSQCGGSVNVYFLRAVSLPDSTVYNALNTDFEVGDYYAEYYAKDSNGNHSDTCQVYFEVKDNGRPSATCVDQLNVSFVGGEARITVAEIDAGSGDNCGVLSKEIRKEGGTWGQEVRITFEEVSNNVRIELRIIDENGSSNTCWTAIKGKDTSAPECGTLEDQSIDCDAFHTDSYGAITDGNENKDFDDNEWEVLTGDLLAKYNQDFGTPVCADDLATVTVEQEYQLVAAPCSKTKIKRRYRAKDNADNYTEWKEQLITLTLKQDFEVVFSADWEGVCGADFPTANLSLDSKGCNILAWTYEDRQFEGVNDACYFIERTYLVTNWCVYEAGMEAIRLDRVEDEHGVSNGLTVSSETLTNVGLFEYVQVLRVTDNTVPEISVAEITECINNEEACSASKTFSIQASDCLEDAVLTYTYQLIEEASGTVIASGESASFTTTISPQAYKVEWIVSDNCGNTASATENYTFKDCTKPAVFCLDGVANVIGAEGKATIWAKDLNQKSTDNCTAEDKLQFRLWHASLADSIAKPANIVDGDAILDLPENLDLGCNELGNQVVEFYVIDEAGNWDVCIASVLIQDGSGTCGNGIIDSTNVAMIAGGILTMNNTPLKDVTLKAKGTVLYEKTIQTNELGIFELDLPKGIGYVISMDKEDDAKNGISVFDIILVSKHILGITPFDSPYKYIAADINRSGGVTAFDMVQMRKIILGIDTEFTDNTTWRFMKVGEDFDPEVHIPNNASESIIIDNLTEDITTLDFVAVKTGDLNHSASLDGLLSAEGRDQRSKLPINIINKEVRRGEEIAIELTLDQLEKIAGLQYNLAFDNLILNRVEAGVINNQYFIATDSQLKICWDQMLAANAKMDNKILLTLNFSVLRDGHIKDFLYLPEQSVREAVTQKDELLDIQLNFEQPSSVDRNFKLYQNTPNPFSENTIIGFDLTERETISLEIFNVQGRLLKQINGTFEKGYNEIAITKEDLKGNGILLYQLRTKQATAFKKMIVLE